MKNLLVWLTAIGGVIAAGGGEVTLPLDAFPKDSYYTSSGRSNIVGMASGILKDGQPGLNVWFDHTGCGAADNVFLRVHFDQELPGTPQRFRLRLSSDAPQDIPIALLVNDANAETYLARGVVRSQSEPQELVLELSRNSAWPSGDRNDIPDLPLRLDCLLVESGAVRERSAGSLLLSDFTLDTVIDAGNCLVIDDVAERLQFGADPVRWQLNLRSLLPEQSGDYHYAVRVEDTYRETVAATEEESFALPLADNGLRRDFAWPLPYGEFAVTVTLSDRAGRTLATRQRKLRHVAAVVDASDSAAATAYDFRYGVNGGVLGFLEPETARKLGVNWFRYENPCWLNVEKSPGEFDFSALRADLERWRAHQIRPISLQCLYGAPKFVDSSDVVAFPKQYGDYLRRLVAATGDLMTEHELGNEDNGNNKFIYTEVARHGAAAIRVQAPWATLSTSGTAFIDSNWLRFQDSRGLLDYFDAICVHPYTNNSTASQAVSPEKCGTLAMLTGLNDVLFDCGGMKELWVTEFGWPNGGAAEERARTTLYVRQMLLADAAHVAINGLYTWERDYGIVNQPAVAAMAWFTRMRRGATPVGLTEADGIYTALYAAPTGTFAVLWSADELAAPVPAEFSGAIYDLFGNRLSRGEARISQEPIYITGVDDALTRRMAAAEAERLKAELLRQLDRGAVGGFWNRWRAVEPTDTGALLAAWEEFLRQDAPLSRTERAAAFFALRWTLAALRFFPADVPEGPVDFAAIRQQVAADHAALNDRAAVRYVLGVADRLSLERELWAADAAAVAAIQTQLRLLEAVAQRLLRNDLGVQYAVFPNLYQMENGVWREQLRLIPGRPGAVRCRVSSYAPRPVAGSIAWQLPEGWSVSPEVAAFELEAEGECWLEFTVTADSAHPGTITALTRIDGAPELRTGFDAIELLPAVELRIPERDRAPEDGNLSFELNNLEAAPVAGELQLRPGGRSGGGFARLRFELAAHGGGEFQVPLPEGVRADLRHNDYRLSADFVLDDGRTFQIDGLDIDFVAARRTAGAVAIDGVLDEWDGALPLKLNKAAYTLGTFGSGWSPEDLSATARLLWDDEALYAAFEVTDQTFNQQFSGDPMWQQDSVQLVLGDGRSAEEYWGATLALSPTGPVMWQENDHQPVPGGELAVIYRNGVALYEARLPWAALPEAIRREAEQGRLHCAVAINDDDAVVPRRVMERFPDTVIHHKRVNAAPVTRLLPEAAPPVPPQTEKVIYFDDFEQCADGTLPLGYAHRHNLMNHDWVKVEDGMLHVVNPAGDVPHQFCILTAPIAVTPGQPYRLTARVKGKFNGFGVLGVASDEYGVQDYFHIPLPEGMHDWMTIQHDFVGPAAGKYRVLIRNVNLIDDLWVDEMKVVEWR